jgi:outer membrane receptor protein involved in Fe transport
MKSLTKPLLALLLVCQIITLNTFAKNDDPGIVTGTIIEKNTNKPVPYASIAVIQNATGEILTGVISDDEGKFKLNGLPYNAYELQITYLGYKKKNVQVKIDKDHNPVQVGSIALEADAQQLNEVTVTEERLKGKQEVDRTVYTVNEEVKRLSKDGTDVLKHIPGVTVDFQDNVTLEGTGNILYLVNGVKRDQQFVAQLNPDDFNKVEVITNPGVEYDADIDAVINIVLKKAPTGGRGGINVTLADPHKIASNQRANLDYGNEKFRIFFSDRLNYQAYRAYSKKETRITDNQNTTEFQLAGSGDASWLRNNANYGIDLFLNDKNVLNFYGSSNAILSKQKDFNETGIQYLNNELTDNYQLETNLHTAGLGFYNSLFYKHKFDQKNHDISVQLNYYTYSDNSDNTFDYHYNFIDSLLAEPLILNRFEDTRNNRKMAEWRSDYTRMAGKIKINAGYWSYFQWLNNNYNTDALLKTNFKYNELRHEIYTSGSGMISKLRWSAGLRYAFSRSEIDKKATNQYHTLLPQLSLMYEVKKGQSLRLTARRSIVRPGMNQLNPFTANPDSLSMVTGNPDLDPQIINRGELQYAINFNKNYLAPKIFVEYSNNSIQQIQYLNSDGISVLKPENIGEKFEYGLTLTASVKFSKWMKINANTYLYNTQVSGESYSDEMVTTGVNGAIVFTPWEQRKINFTSVIQYTSPRLGYKSELTRDVLWLLVADASINENFKLSAVFNPLSQKFKYSATERIDSNYYWYEEGRVDVSQLFMITISYNFKWGNTPKTLERSTDYEDDGGGGLF